MGEHTPGPWSTHPDYYGPYIEVHDATGRTIVYVDLSTDNPADDAVGHADAHLIASAPRLLGTLEDVESLLTYPDDDCADCSPEEMCGYHAILADVRAAIAEARGEVQG